MRSYFQAKLVNNNKDDLDFFLRPVIVSMQQITDPSVFNDQKPTIANEGATIEDKVKVMQNRKEKQRALLNLRKEIMKKYTVPKKI